jgi:hypothetical protein
MIHSVGSVIKAKFAKLANHGLFEEIHVWATSWASSSIAAESLEQKLNRQNSIDLHPMTGQSPSEATGAVPSVTGAVPSVSDGKASL